MDDLTPLRGLEQVDKIDVSFPKVTTLAGLENIKTGWLLVKETSIRDLRGLENFRGRELTLTGNAQLESFEGLDSLEDLEYLGIRRSPALTSLATFPKVSIERLVLDDTGLVDLTGLEHLTSANLIEIIFNTKLQSLHGLENLTQMWAYPDGNVAYLHLEQNTLPDLSGLDGLVTVEGFIEIKNDVAATLSSLHGLENLKHVLANLTIVAIPELTSLDPLRPDREGSLTYVGQTLELRLNQKLPTCEAKGLAQAILDVGTLGGEFIDANLEDACSP